MRTLAANQGCRAAFILLIALNVCFYPAIWSGKTLLSSAREAPSILHIGAAVGSPSVPGFTHVADPGAAAWQNESWWPFIAEQYRRGVIPLWNPYEAYGEPFAADMLSQPFFPLTALFIFHVGPRIYNFYILLRLFIAGIFAYFYFRRFVSFTAAIAGAIALMLGGYYVLFLTIAHLSVEILLPAVLLAGEYLLETKTYKSVVWFSIVIALVFFGGMPESALVLLTFAALYVLLRLASDTALRSAAKKTLVLLLASATAGIGMAALLLLPFFEFVGHSQNIHQPSHVANLVGLAHHKLDLSAFLYLVPLRFGPPNTPVQTQPFENYIGLLSILLAVLALAGGWKTNAHRDRRLDVLAWFFAICAALIFLKRYGCPMVNWVGALPGFNLVEFYKYDEPILSFCMSALCAIGIQRVKLRQVSRSWQWIGLSLTALLLAVAAFATESKVDQEIIAGRLLASFPKLSIELPALLLFILLLTMLADFLYSRRIRAPVTTNTWLAALLTLLLAIEVAFNYTVPMFRMYVQLPSVRVNPYAGAAFVRFLQKNTGDYSRIFGRDWILMPGWSSVFHLFDIRDMDGLFYRKYFDFVQNFAAPRKWWNPELYSAFLGTDWNDFHFPIERRLLQLSSIRYVLTWRPFPSRNERIEAVLDQNEARLTPKEKLSVRRGDFLLGGFARDSLRETAPYARLPYKVRVGDDQRRFLFSYALDPAAFGLSNGVRFTIEIQDSSGHIDKVFESELDPRHNVSETRWVDEEIDVSRYRGQQITLLFSTAAGRRGDITFGWAAWSNFHFDNEMPDAPPDLKLVYNAETKIYEYGPVLPRAAVYYHAVIEKDGSSVLRKLADPSLDIFRSVVIDNSKLSNHQLTELRELGNGPLQPADAARIRLYRPQVVEIEASLKRRGILVLNDSDYPGWVVSVDGHPNDWFSANYLFRGVLLPPGSHIVKFEYRPDSFRWGAIISLLTCCALAGFGFKNLQRRRAHHTRQALERIMG